MSDESVGKSTICGSGPEPGYWLHLIWNECRYRLRRKQFVPLVRSLWHTIIHHDNGERCQDCGRDYFSTVWYAPSKLYEEVHGNRGSQYCPACFGAAARAKGIALTWTPVVYRRNGEPEHLDDFDRIEASKWDVA